MCKQTQNQRLDLNESGITQPISIAYPTQQILLFHYNPGSMKHSNHINRNLLQYFDTVEVPSIQPILIKSLEKLSSSAKSELFHKKEERQHYVLDAVSTHNRRVTLFFSPRLLGFSMGKKRDHQFFCNTSMHTLAYFKSDILPQKT